MHEPIYDDISLDMIKTQNRQELVGQIWQYTLALERYVVKLRSQVNDLAENQQLNLPYPDIESDFAVRFFSDHPAYKEFKDDLSKEETKWKIPD